ncbi:hypothetical protein PsYK624_013000 [Phanerochaete sordida]|uniref:Uncharacterized protein n=1 Tax=Phanerochaete sordida TaxID=48140 RepID=A0A9P3FXW9_9APHY|nr:hypothetical protein PsYK624_013000 [Phanerochaete sordida]
MLPYFYDTDLHTLPYGNRIALRDPRSLTTRHYLPPRAPRRTTLSRHLHSATNCQADRRTVNVLR